MSGQLWMPGRRSLPRCAKARGKCRVMKTQLEALRLQKEGLENLIADQRNAWEEEKTKQDLEEKEREENLKALRQREEEEYRLMRENEQMQARQKFEEELEAMRQKSAEIRTREETDILARESALKKKEQELSRLMQELEKFLSGLAGRKATGGSESGRIGSGFGLIRRSPDIPTAIHGRLCIECPRLGAPPSRRELKDLQMYADFNLESGISNLESPLMP